MNPITLEEAVESGMFEFACMLTGTLGLSQNEFLPLFRAHLDWVGDLLVLTEEEVCQKTGLSDVQLAGVQRILFFNWPAEPVPRQLTSDIGEGLILLNLGFQFSDALKFSVELVKNGTMTEAAITDIVWKALAAGKAVAPTDLPTAPTSGRSTSLEDGLRAMAARDAVSAPPVATPAVTTPQERFEAMFADMVTAVIKDRPEFRVVIDAESDVVLTYPSGEELFAIAKELDEPVWKEIAGRECQLYPNQVLEMMNKRGRFFELLRKVAAYRLRRKQPPR